MPETFPADWSTQPCFIVTVPRALVPYVGGLLKILENRGFWASDADYERAYNAVLGLEGCLMSTCLTELLERQDALYRLVNTAVFGQTYSIVTETPLVVSPTITPMVDLTVFNQDSIMGRLDRMTQLVDNTVNGTATDLYSYDPSVKALLQSVIDALTAEETDIGSLLTELEVIAGLLA